MTQIKIDTKLAAPAGEALDRHVEKLYAKRNARIVGVVELAHIERLQPAPDAAKEASVKLRIVALEIANPDQEPTLREAQRALFLHRTAAGKLTEDGDLELTKTTLDRTTGLLGAIETARLRAGIAAWSERARAATITIGQHEPSVMAKELRALADGLADLLTDVGQHGLDNDGPGES